ncbi:MAG: NUDIX hydrolase [Desulfobulbaceae bacterium]|nr:MAG: NUDIX hydrolase [Desulfobulbaceae bacterium]
MAAKIQYGVIPYICGKGAKRGSKIILVTSKTNGYWIFPKGNPVKNKTSIQSAKQEAYEEAGLTGSITGPNNYSFSIHDKGGTYTIVLFPMKVKNVLEEWPEMSERNRTVTSVGEALQLIRYSELQYCLKQWHQDNYCS